MCYYAGFIDYIVSPIFDVCGDMLELLSSPSDGTSTAYSRPWRDNLTHNRERWLANNYMDKHMEEGAVNRFLWMRLVLFYPNDLLI